MENIFDITTTDFSLYNAFCKQTRRTFWTFLHTLAQQEDILHTLAQQEDIYSTHLTDFGPYKDSPVDYYVFSNGKEIVLLFVEKYTLKQEKIDKAKGTFCSSCVDDLVPIIDVTRFVKRRVDVVAPGTKVQSIMLSDRECFDDLMEWMDVEFPFRIIDNLRTLNKRSIEVNEQHGEKGKKLMDDVIHCDCILPEEDEITVRKCIEDGDDDDEEDDKDDEEYYEEEQTPEEDDEYDFDKALQDFLERTAEDAKEERQSPFSISHSQIDQNENAKVNVEILRLNQEPQLALLNLVGCDEIKRRMDELLALP